MAATEENDGRLSFNEAVVFVKQRKKSAFAAMPVFGDDEDDVGPLSRPRGRARQPERGCACQQQEAIHLTPSPAP